MTSFDWTILDYEYETRIQKIMIEAPPGFHGDLTLPVHDISMAQIVESSIIKHSLWLQK
jgi:hypothetical protein